MFTNGQDLNYYVEYGGIVQYNPVVFVRYTDDGYKAIVNIGNYSMEVSTFHLSVPKVRN